MLKVIIGWLLSSVKSCLLSGLLTIPFSRLSCRAWFRLTSTGAVVNRVMSLVDFRAWTVHLAFVRLFCFFFTLTPPVCSRAEILVVASLRVSRCRGLSLIETLWLVLLTWSARFMFVMADSLCVTMLLMNPDKVLTDSAGLSIVQARTGTLAMLSCWISGLATDRGSLVCMSVMVLPMLPRVWLSLALSLNLIATSVVSLRVAESTRCMLMMSVTSLLMGWMIRATSLDGVVLGRVTSMAMTGRLTPGTVAIGSCTKSMTLMTISMRKTVTGGIGRWTD